jgi:hypothetical protein
MQLEDICLNINTKPLTDAFDITKDIAFRHFAAPQLQVKNENLNKGVSGCKNCVHLLYVYEAPLTKALRERWRIGGDTAHWISA